MVWHPVVKAGLVRCHSEGSVQIERGLANFHKHRGICLAMVMERTRTRFYQPALVVHAIQDRLVFIVARYRDITASSNLKLLAVCV